jgi:predicted PurR-regulated permease PerM
MAINAALQRAALAGICVSAALFIAWAGWQVIASLGPVLSLFFGGWLLGCLLEPVIRRVMSLAHVRRPGAVAATYLTLLGALAVAWITLGPAVSQQVSASVASLPATTEAAAQQLLNAQDAANGRLAAFGLPIRIDLASRTGLESTARQLGLQVDSNVASPLAVLSGAVDVLGRVGTMLLLSIFFVVGGPQLADQLTDAFGGQIAADLRFVLRAVHDTFEGFFRAQVLQSVLYAAGVWVCLALARVDVAPPVAILAGALLLVPVIGAAVAVLVPVVASLVYNPSATLAVGGVLVLLQQLVLNGVGPRLMGQQLGLPPLLVFFGVLAGGQLGGFWGAVFGIPVLATVMTCFDHFGRRAFANSASVES